MFNTLAYCLQATADLLKFKDVATMTSSAPYWTDIITDAQTSAYQEIEGRLFKRGFILAQIVAWDRGAEFELSIMKYLSLVNGGGLSGNYDDRFIKMLDRRRELDDVMVSVAGVYIVPGQSQPGTINFGTQKQVGRHWPGAADAPGCRHGDSWDRENW